MLTLSTPVMIFYALPALALAMIGLVYFAYIPTFYSLEFSDSLVALGGIILLTRVFDAVLDPVVGRLSDRGVFSFGRYRRKQFLLPGALLLTLGFVAVSTPSYSVGAVKPELGFAIWSVILFVGWSLFAVPYEALGAELSFDYEGRSKLFACRDGAIAVGTLAAVVLLETLKASFALDTALFIFAVVAVSLLAVTTAGLSLQVRETVGTRGLGGAAGNYFAPLQNKAFRTILIAYTMSGFGAALPATLLLFFATFVLGQDVGGMYLGIYLLCCVLGFPLWVYLCRSLEKRKAWIYATLVNSGAFLFTLLIGEGDFIPFGVIVVISGLGFAGTQLYPSSMQADIIDLEESKTGTRQEGAFVGLWSVSRKCAAALGAGIALPILAYFGFDPALNEQPEGAVTTLSFLYAGVPAICALGSLLVLGSYPISRSEHEEVSANSASKWLVSEEAV